MDSAASRRRIAQSAARRASYQKGPGPAAAPRLVIPVLLAGAALLRVAWWHWYVRVIENEGVEYVRLAWNWFHGHGYVSTFGGRHTLNPPLYPILIGLTTPLTGNGEAAARLVSLAAGLLLVWVVYRLGCRLFDPTVAAIAGIITAIHPVLIALSVSTYVEAVYVPLAASAILAVVACLDHASWSRAALAGALVAAAHLCRPEGLGLAPLLAAVLGVAYWRRGQVKLGLTQAGALVTVCLLVAAPNTIWLSSQAGAFRWEGKSGYNSLVTERMRAGMSLWEATRGLDSLAAPAGAFLFRDQVELLRRDAGGIGATLSALMVAPVRRTGMVLRGMARPWLGGIVILLLASVGLVMTGWWRTGLARMAAVLTLPVLSATALLTLDWYWGRYFLALLPSLILLASAGAAWIAQWSRLVALGLLLIPLLRSAQRLPRLFDLAQTRDVEMRVTGEWIRKDFPEREPTLSRPLIMGLRLAPIHYAGGEVVYLPWAEEARALQFIQRVGPDYIVLHDGEVNQVPYGSKWFTEGISATCAEPVALPAGAERHRVWRWTCKQ